jgi:hypothetical protein
MACLCRHGIGVRPHGQDLTSVRISHVRIDRSLRLRGRHYASTQKIYHIGDLSTRFFYANARSHGLSSVRVRIQASTSICVTTLACCFLHNILLNQDPNDIALLPEVRLLSPSFILIAALFTTLEL